MRGVLAMVEGEVLKQVLDEFIFVGFLGPSEDFAIE
jgi:hypothetical protein